MREARKHSAALCVTVEGTEEGHGSFRFGPGTLSGNELLPDFNRTSPASLVQGAGKPFLCFANGRRVTRTDPILVAERVNLSPPACS